MGIRFTSWLSEDERKALSDVAEHEGCSENFIVRSALRSLLFGLEPSSCRNIREAAHQLREHAHNHATGARV